MTSGDGFPDGVRELLESDDAVDAARGAAILCEWDAAHPDDAHAQYLIASACDSAGREAEAMRHYERALAIGVERLPPGRRPEIFVQAGSTLRNLGRTDEARALLEAGIARFPHYRALRVFLALLERGAGDHAKAAGLLLDVLAMDEDASLARYRRSLRGYVDELAGRHAGET
jgi:tetratricopeptide (TPR) repeat protein